MRPPTPLRKFGISSLALVAALLLQLSSSSASAEQQQEHPSSQQQQQSSQQQATPPQQNSQPQSDSRSTQQSETKQKKVWTNDDLIALRTPADIYLLEKEAAEAAAAEEAAKKEADAKQIKEGGLTLELPSTAEETQRLINTRQDQIKDMEDGIDRLNKDLPEALPDKKPETEKQIELLNGYLQKAQLELKALQDHLQDLAKTKPSEPASTLPSSPSPLNPL
jgi:hypothetical protein